MSVGLLSKALKGLVYARKALPQMSACMLHQWLLSFDDVGKLRAALVVRMMFFFKRLVDDRCCIWTPSYNQGSLSYFKAKGWLTKKNAAALKYCRLIMIGLCTLWGARLVQRFEKRCTVDPRLCCFLWFVRLHFDPDVRGLLGFEDVEALFCEGIDCLLSAQGERCHPFKTAVFEAFSLGALPLVVTVGSEQRLVEVDMRPQHWHLQPREQREAFFARVAQTLRAARDALAA